MSVAGTTTARIEDRTAGAETPRRRGLRLGKGRRGPGRERRPLTRPARRLLAVLVVLAVLGGGGAWIVYGTGLLEVRAVSVAGTEVLTRDQVREAAAVPMRRPLAAVDTSAVERRLLAGLPRIDRVKVERFWPHTLRLVVTERRPVAVLRRAGGYTEVDKGGVRFADVAEAPSGVPVVELKVKPSGSGQAAGRGYFGTERLLRSAVEVAAALPAPVRRVTEAIEVRSFDGIRLRLSGGRAVVWGSSQEGARKAAALTAVMRADRGAKRYDVSAPSSPASAG